MDLGLTKSQKTALRRAAHNYDYHLLLGAGASCDSIASTGSYVPLGRQLASMLAEQFAVENDPGDMLWRIYDRAVRKAGEASVYRWLHGLFWDVTAPDWADVLARTPWNTVWTLNLDDTFEQAYARVSSDVSRELAIVNWDDEYRIGRELAVVHLHGCVDRDTSRRLIFSLSEYGQSADVKAAWPINFRDQYGVAPFVVIGARLRDEPDIERVVANRRPAHEAPSFYVSPHISPAMESDLRTWQLVPVRMTAAEFACIWPELTGLALDAPPARRDEIGLRFGRLFKELKRRAKKHDFLGGDEPEWSDIEDGTYAELEWIRAACSDCRRLGNGAPAASALIYVGKRLTGRSTGLLAIGKHLRELSWRPFLFSGSERLDLDAIVHFAADGKAVALLFDSVADYADDVNQLLSRARAADLKIACIAVDDSEQENGIAGRISSGLLFNSRIATIGSRLNKSDAIRMVKTLTDEGRLGTIEPVSDVKRIAHFKNHELFDAMAQVENAPAFGRRIDELITSFDSSAHLDVLLLAALASFVGRQFDVVDAARMAGMESDRLVRIILDDYQLRTVLKTDGKLVRTRHRWMALKPCIDRLGQSQALGILSTAMNRVAPRLGRASQRERNATTTLVGSIMKYKILVKVFPDADLVSWYESLTAAFGDWSARYWEQRAIACRRQSPGDAGLLARAESYANRAVSLVRDSYSLTTLGVTLIWKAAFVPGVDVGKFYDQAADAFDAAKNLDSHNIVTDLAYLRSGLKLMASENLRRSADELVDRVCNDWVRSHDQVRLASGASSNANAELAGYRRQFDSLTRALRSENSLSFGRSHAGLWDEKKSIGQPGDADPLIKSRV